MDIAVQTFFSYCMDAVHFMYSIIDGLSQYWFFQILLAAGFIYVGLDIFQRLFVDPGDDYDDYNDKTRIG